MQRLSRAGRKTAIVNAIVSLNARGKHKMHTRGEICRKMGIRSTSKIRDLLHELVVEGRLVDATTALDSYADEIAIYGIAVYRQTPLPDHEITINGVSCKMSEYQGSNNYA